MPDVSYPVEMINGALVVTAPAELDVTTADQLASRAPRGQAWETTRCQAYQAHLAGRAVGETFGRTAAFLTLAAADALSITVTGAHAGR